MVSVNILIVRNCSDNTMTTMQEAPLTAVKSASSFSADSAALRVVLHSVVLQPVSIVVKLLPASESNVAR